MLYDIDKINLLDFLFLLVIITIYFDLYFLNIYLL